MIPALRSTRQPFHVGRVQLVDVRRYSLFGQFAGHGSGCLFGREFFVGHLFSPPGENPHKIMDALIWTCGKAFPNGSRRAEKVGRSENRRRRRLIVIPAYRSTRQPFDVLRGQLVDVRRDSHLFRLEGRRGGCLFIREFFVGHSFSPPREVHMKSWMLLPISAERLFQIAHDGQKKSSPCPLTTLRSRTAPRNTHTPVTILAACFARS